MYNTDFWSRASIQQICNFLMTGAEKYSEEQGTPKERHLRYSRALDAGIRTFQDRVQNFDWNTCDSKTDQNIKTDAMWEEILQASSQLSDLAFEMGFIAALSIGWKIVELQQPDSIK